MKCRKGKSIVKKYFLSSLFFLFCIFIFISNVSGNSANLSGNSFSLMLGDTSTLIDGELFQLLFTTYDGDRYSLPYYYSSGIIYYSRELKKVGSLYKTDYYTLFSDYIDDYGEVSINLYSGDSNNNGIDDVCEKSMSFYQSITGTWYSQDGTSGAIGGTMTKIAGYQQGSYTFNIYNTEAGTQSLSGVYYVGTLSGTISYNPSLHSMVATFNTIFDTETQGDPFTTTYEIIDTNHIRVNAMEDFPTTIFTRNGNVYTAIVTLLDGNTATFWTDYETWYISIQDNNNSDGDNVPDFSDFCPEDPNKINLGICGCGVADTDIDGDGEADCIDPDVDGDGFTNIAEIQCGSDPANPNSKCGRFLPFLMLLLD